MRLLALPLLFASNFAYKFDDCEQLPLTLSQVHRVGSKTYSYNLDFFHQRALPYSVIYAFSDVFLQINLTNADQYRFYQGPNCTSVQQLYYNDNRYFGLLRKAALLRSHHLSPFNDTIIGVCTTEPYEISVSIWNVNYVRVFIYAGAVLLFFLASKLVRNVVFYYTSGCSFGLLASLLLVAFIVWRVTPKKTIGIPILIGGWSVSLLMLHFAWENLQSIMFEYQKYVIGYFTVVLLISMAVCYKRGPPTDDRSHNIAQWTLQLVALALIYFSVQMVEVSIGTIVALISQEICRGFLLSGIRWYFIWLKVIWRKAFPAPRKLLNKKEYKDQTEKTTEEQLALLREHCKQEISRPWKIAGNVRNARRRRLARFIEGEDDHVTDDEVYAHELTGDVLDREDYNGDYDNYLDRDFLTPNGSNHDSLDNYLDNDDEWDEIVVKRNASDHGVGSVHSVRVPRSVSARLLSPYNNKLNRSLGARVGYTRELSSHSSNNYYSDHRPRVSRTKESSHMEYGARSGRVDLQRFAAPSSITDASASVMTRSECMRRIRRVDATSKTPTRKTSKRAHLAESEDADE